MVGKIWKCNESLNRNEKPKARQSLLRRTQGPRKVWDRRVTWLKQCFRKIKQTELCRLDGRGKN